MDAPELILIHNDSAFKLVGKTLLYAGLTGEEGIEDNWAEVEFDRIDPELADHAEQIRFRLDVLNHQLQKWEKTLPLAAPIEAFIQRCSKEN